MTAAASAALDVFPSVGLGTTVRLSADGVVGGGDLGLHGRFVAPRLAVLERMDAHAPFAPAPPPSPSPSKQVRSRASQRLCRTSSAARGPGEVIVSPPEAGRSRSLKSDSRSLTDMAVMSSASIRSAASSRWRARAR